MGVSVSNYLSVPGFLPAYPLFVIVALVLAYFCGSIPVALIAGRALGGIDIRQHGSGNTGTTNVLRVLGWGPGFLVLAGDILKGSLGCLIVSLGLNQASSAILAASSAVSTPVFEGLIVSNEVVSAGFFLHDIPLALAILACILGHMFSPFMGFKGGKGIATAFGTLLVVMPLVAVFVLAIFAVCVLITRIVSVGSIIAAISLPVGIMLFYGTSISYLVFGILATVVIVYAHRKNIVRLLKGEEPRFSVGSSNKRQASDVQQPDVQQPDVQVSDVQKSDTQAPAVRKSDTQTSDVSATTQNGIESVSEQAKPSDKGKI